MNITDIIKFFMSRCLGKAKILIIFFMRILADMKIVATFAVYHTTNTLRLKTDILYGQKHKSL